MKNKALMIKVLITSTAMVASAAHAAQAVATAKILKPAVQKYLQERGSFCLGKFEWPISVSRQDRGIGTNNAIQMPVLEKLGLVAGSGAANDPSTKEYELTAEGQKYYLPRKSITVDSAGQRIEHQGDFCAARLQLDKVVSWDIPAVVDGKIQTTVKFTYRVASAAPWTRDPDVRKSFPMIPRILDSAGTLQLTQQFIWSGHEWVPAGG